MKWTIYQFRSSQGRLPVEEWYDGLEDREQAGLDRKIDVLEQNGPKPFERDWCPAIGGGLYVIKVKGGRGRKQLRPVACRGPNDAASEMTLLFGAIEKGDKYVPADFQERAAAIKKELDSDPDERRRLWQDED